MRRITPMLVLAAFFISCGGQWAVLQGVAWITMIHDYAQLVPLSEAVGMTFSGNYPCAICQALAEKKQAEQAKFVLQKVDKKFTSAAIVLPARLKRIAFPHQDYLTFFPARSETPPTPPPRQLLFS